MPIDKEMATVDPALLQGPLDAAKRLGAAAAEAVTAREVGLEIEVAKGEVETLALSESIGLGVRVFTADRRMGFAYTTDLAAGAGRVVEAAWQNAQANAPDEHNVLLDMDTVSEDDWCEEDFAAIAVPAKIAFSRDLEQRTLDADSRITHVQEAAYSDSLVEFSVANSHGLRRTYRAAYCSCCVVAVAAENGSDPEMGYEFDFGRRFEALRLDWVARSTAERVVRCLGGKPCPSGSVPVVLDNRVAAAFLQVLGPALRADNVLKGKSLFAGRNGEAIASPHVTLVDRNDLDAGLNRAPFDGEGAPAQETVLVEKGVLRGYLHNAYTAHRMGVETTANAGRGGFRSTPEVGATNCFLSPGPATQADLAARAGDGLLVTSAMGVHTADPISGDFSFGAAGLMIENGELGRPVRGVTIAGNMKDLLHGIDAVGSDLRFFGAYGAPSVLVSQLTVSGE